MPAGDGTGPQGMGGRCTPLWTSGQITRPVGGPLGFGRGAGRMGGRGQGRGHRWIYQQTGLPYWARAGTGTLNTTPAQSKEQEIQLLEQELNQIKNRLDELRRE